MSHKKAGILVASLLVILALVVYILSNVKLTPKKDKADTQSSMTSVSTTSPAESISDESTSDNSSTSEPESVSSGLSLVEIVAEDKLDYSSPEQQTTGVVIKKSCYLLNTQVVYAIELQATMGTESKVVEYICSYSVYSQVEEGDMLNIAYKQTTTNTFAVMSVSK